jgi:rhodanese-related sulfurtransferase
MHKLLAITLLLNLSLSGMLHAEEEKESKMVMITSNIFSVDVMHKGEKVTIKRNQDRENSISKYYQPTHRGRVQPINPFEPHAVETIGTLEMLDYLKQNSDGKESIIIIDSRTKAWVKRGTIPGSVNIPFNEFSSNERAVEVMEENFDVLSTGNSLDFTNAKTLVMFCNGIWCGQSPTAIKKLLRYGYPAAKIKYFRGGMQNWESLGLTVVAP